MTRTVVQPYFWVVAKYEGRLVVIGPKQSEQEALEFGYQKLEGLNFDVVELQTRDRARATSQIKAKCLDRTADLGESIKWAHHRNPRSGARGPESAVGGG